MSKGLGSPNFRHPVTLAKELITLDDVSEGRITLGIGAGGTGVDATTLRERAAEPWTPEFHPVRRSGRRPIDSLEGFVDFAGRHAELGFDEIVVHWPIPDSDFAADEKLFERIATEALGQL